MKKYCLLEKLIKLTEMCVEDSRTKVKVEEEMSEGCFIRMGVREEDDISYILFNVAVEKALQKDNTFEKRCKVRSRFEHIGLY